MNEFFSMTRDGYNRIKAEIERLENVEMPLIGRKSQKRERRGISKRTQSIMRSEKIRG